MPTTINNDGTTSESSGGGGWLSKLMSGPFGGPLLGGAGNILSAVAGAFSNPYKREFKYWGKKLDKKMENVEKIKPKNDYVNIAGNMPAMNDAMNAQVNRAMALYRGGATGDQPNQAPSASYPWYKRP